MMKRHRFDFPTVIGLLGIGAAGLYAYQFVQSQPKPQASSPGIMDSIMPYAPYLIGGVVLLGALAVLARRKKQDAIPIPASNVPKDVRIAVT